MEIVKLIGADVDLKLILEIAKVISRLFVMHIIRMTHMFHLKSKIL